MLRALYSSAAGMQSQQMNLDVIANNLANVNTTGFKKAKIEFQEELNAYLLAQIQLLTMKLSTRTQNTYHYYEPI